MKNIGVMKKSVGSRIATPLLFFSSFLAFFMVYHMPPPSSISTLHILISSTTRHSIRESTLNGQVQPPLNGPMTMDIITCDRSQYFYDICSINGPAVFDPARSTFVVNGPNVKNGPNLKVEKVRPYARKWENFTMSNIKEVTLMAGPLGPSCDVNHTVSALVFSVGGYTGNFFHDFNDGFIPLFITVNSLFPNQDFIMVISQLHDWWVEKYEGLLRNFSKYPIIDFDKENITHCFPKTTIGLMSHGFMTIDPKLIPNSKTILDFRTFLATTYGTIGISPDDTTLKPHLDLASRHGNATTYGNIGISPDDTTLEPRLVLASRHGSATAYRNIGISTLKPRLVLASRHGSAGRVILNQHEVKTLAKKTGFEVILFEPRTNTSLAESFGLINSSHAMLGVHGAALTHAMFLRPGSVFIQVIPIGAEGVSELCFGKLAKNLELNYEEYKIEMHESSLAEKYGKEGSKVLIDPLALQAKGWSKEIMDIYLRQQNVRLDLKRLRTYLKRAYHKAKVFMDKNG